MDAVMYLFWENTILCRWIPDRVAFMNCLFAEQIIGEYRKFLTCKRGFKLSDWILHYRTGELPSHERTRKTWDIDIDRLYTPMNVNNNHWISLCINFKLRTIEVFDCGGSKHITNIEAFAVIIPKIVKEVQAPKNKKHLKVVPYSVLYTPMKPKINKSQNDCGVYALKFIECHLFGHSFTMLDDENIKMARLKIVCDLWHAAQDLVLIERMSRYEPTPATESEIVEI
ncbi:hypothetical protein EUTSA_v10021988mg [Eutrema salsugineum]|uniref:Ubiquitin-like protease family profile domain-containing protein n=1 Tax=Eutrema salsugineum TaxID=72664 RepID=V4LYE8_EUTSA|nr:hypothetical protein EUTSA_v10021988mg [Eutrema salsugineum]